MRATSSSNKYHFVNVLVSDTKFRTNLSSSRHGSSAQPPVLVLMSRLNKCHDPSSNCASCCLQVERPEFRRRSGDIPTSTAASAATTKMTTKRVASPEPECFADCGHRRAINIDLVAGARLSGKLVVLALTRVQNLIRSAEEGTKQAAGRRLIAATFKCHSKYTKAFARFEPSSSTDKLQTFYSRMSDNRLPGISINSIDVHWNETEGISQETFSLSMESVGRQLRRGQQIESKETLLVNEFDCQISNKHYNDSNSKDLSTEFPLTSDELDEEDKLISQQSVGKVQLLALINREVASRGPMKSTANGLSGSPIANSTATLDSQSSSRLDSIQPLQISQNQQNSNHVTSTTISGKTTSDSPANTISQRMDNFHQAIIVNKLKSTSNLPGSQLGSSPKMVDVEFSDTSMTAPPTGPIYMTDFDAVRMRLRSNSLLMLTVSSSFVILTYTICLIIYLKSRNRFKSKSSKREIRPNAGDILPPRPPVPVISRPFNLQMPAATRLRLEMLLKMGNRRPPVQRAPKTRTRADRSQDSNHLESAQRCGSARCVTSRQSTCRTFKANVENSTKCYENCNWDSQIATQTGVQGPILDAWHHDSSPAYGTLNVVRAIRHAATLARSRIRNSYYRPNLNVIPESDLEQLHSPVSRAEVELCASFLLNQNALLGNGCHISEQLESLVQDAMSLECSHAVERSYNEIDQQQRTLLSIPLESEDTQSNGSPKTEGTVSRIRILRNVKGDNLYEEHREANSMI